MEHSLKGSGAQIPLAQGRKRQFRRKGPYTLTSNENFELESRIVINGLKIRSWEENVWHCLVQPSLNVFLSSMYSGDLWRRCMYCNATNDTPSRNKPTDYAHGAYTCYSSCSFLQYEVASQPEGTCMHVWEVIFKGGILPPIEHL